MLLFTRLPGRYYKMGVVLYICCSGDTSYSRQAQSLYMFVSSLPSLCCILVHCSFRLLTSFFAVHLFDNTRKPITPNTNKDAYVSAEGTVKQTYPKADYPKEDTPRRTIQKRNYAPTKFGEIFSAVQSNRGIRPYSLCFQQLSTKGRQARPRGRRQRCPCERPIRL
jgi:hypothetical protein